MGLKLEWVLPPPEYVQVKKDFPWSILVTGEPPNFKDYHLELDIREPGKEKVDDTHDTDISYVGTPLLIPHQEGWRCMGHRLQPCRSFAQFKPRIDRTGTFELLVYATKCRTKRGICVLRSNLFNVVAEEVHPLRMAQIYTSLPLADKDLARELDSSAEFGGTGLHPAFPYLDFLCEPSPKIVRGMDFYPPPVLRVKGFPGDRYPDLAVKIEILAARINHPDIKPVKVTPTLEGACQITPRGLSDSGAADDTLEVGVEAEVGLPHRYAVFSRARIAGNVLPRHRYQLRALLYDLSGSESDKPISIVHSSFFTVKTGHEKAIQQVAIFQALGVRLQPPLTRGGWADGEA